MKIKNKILCLLLLLLLLMISLLVFVNKKESINALVLYRSSIDELAPLSSDITENTNIKINYKQKAIFRLQIYGKILNFF